MRPIIGFLFCTGVKDASGASVPLAQAARLGWIIPERGYDGIGRAPIGPNLFVDGGRQYAIYSFAFRAPAQDYTIQKFGVGTGTRPPSSTDTALESPVAFQGGAFTKAIDSIEFPAPYTMRVIFTLGAGDCNGYLLTEFGLFAGDDTLLARVSRPGINKSSAFAPTLSHELRF